MPKKRAETHAPMPTSPVARPAWGAANSTYYEIPRRSEGKGHGAYNVIRGGVGGGKEEKKYFYFEDLDREGPRKVRMDENRHR